MVKPRTLLWLAAAFGCTWAVGVSTWALIEFVPPTRGELKECPTKLRMFGGTGSPGKPFWIVAYVRGHRPGQPIELSLPAGLRLVEEQSVCRSIIEPILPASFHDERHSVYRTIPASGPVGYSEVKWRVIAAAAGQYIVVTFVPEIGYCFETVNVYEPCICFLD